MTKQIVLLVILGCASGFGQPASKPIRVVYLVGGIAHDYEKMPAALVEELKRDLAVLNRLAEVEVTKDLAAFDEARLKQTDLLMMNTCQQKTEVSQERRQAVLAAVRSGLPIVALHCTFWSFQAWPEFRQMLGAFVPGHARFGPMCVRPTSDAGPLAAGLQPEFELKDEPYYVNERDPSIKVIVQTCNVYDGRNGVEPSVWTKMFGKGRIFAMTFGHDMQSQGSESYLRLFKNGLRWALGLE
jgi:hypothetical protein